VVGNKNIKDDGHKEMSRIRRIRLYFERNKIDQKINFLWFLAGLVTIPLITGLVGLLRKFEPEWLCAIVVIESVVIATLSITCAVLLDKIKVVNKHLEETNVTWEKIESDFEFGNVFEEKQ
jgi:hypothetical protein